MNTLSRAITARFFSTSQDYKAFQLHWSSLVNSERKSELTSVHYLIYLALRGKDWRKAFTPITNQRKLDNGAVYDWGLFHALHRLHYAPHQVELIGVFDGLIRPETLVDLRRLVPLVSPYYYENNQLVMGCFPFEAYSDDAVNKLRPTTKKAQTDA